MTTLINKSNHPVNIKKINILVWTLRDEIEAAIQKRIEEQGSENVDIEDIKNFYSNLAARKPEYEDIEDEDLEGQNIQPGIEDTSEMESEDSTEESTEENENAESQKSAEKAGDMADELIKEASKADESAAQKPTDHTFKRVRPPKEKMVPGFAFLSEVHMEQLLFFGKRSYTTGQNIIVEFLVPKKFSVSAEVRSTIHIDRSSRIISDTKPSHRIQGDFLFLFDGERGTLRDFLKSVEPEIPPPPKKIKAQQSEDEEDDFDDLGF